MNYNNTASAVRRVAVALLGALVLLAATLVSAEPAQAASALPGGKKNWVVAVGGLDRPEVTDYRNWVRLGYYEFHESGTVKTNFWDWHQREQPERKPAMNADCDGVDVPVCDIRTVEGFENPSAGPWGGYEGTFVYDPIRSVVVVTWKKKADGTDLPQSRSESWQLETGLAGGKVARISSPTYYENLRPEATVPTSTTWGGAFSDYGATFGVGYGSNAELDAASRVSMDELLTDDVYSKEQYRGANVSAKAGIVGREGAGGDWTFSGEGGENPKDPWKRCSGAACMGFLQAGTTCLGQVDDVERVRYIGEIGGGRRNLEEIWCQGLAASSEDCYQYNSHPRPMLQVIDDSGKFQGWVGVEAFTHVSTKTNEPDQDWSSGYWSVFDMVSMDHLRPPIPATELRPLSKFELSHGNSVASGDLRWFRTLGKESVTFEGGNKVVSGCRFVEVVVFAADGTKQARTSSPFCINSGDLNSTRQFEGNISFAGLPEPTHAQITYWVADDQTGPYETKGTVRCTATDGACVSSPRDPGPVTVFKLRHGASLGTGAVSWYNRSTRITGNNHIESGCRFVEMVATGADGSVQRATTTRHCSAGDHPFGQVEFDFGDFAPRDVVVTYWASDDAGRTYATKEIQKCNRTGCVTDNTAADWVTEFRTEHGASVGAGSATWYNRSVTLNGNNHVASGCRFVEMVATGANGSVQRSTTTRHCSAGDHPFSQVEFDFGDFAPRDVVVTYWASEDGGLTYATKETQKCTRGGCVTDSGARDEITEFRLTHGASVGTGELQWLERSVTFIGNNHVASGCRYVLLTGTGADGSVKTASTTKFCSAGDHPFGPQTLNFSLVDNGAQRVVVDYYADDGSGYQLKDSTTCTRAGGCV
ncbi:hypothetical protein [Streptomyces sp. NBC_01794]|uniref:hypothetical protein n=1 Tax=Streptomyces sp. NBC_01794 TaxID=2975942 RepID=UPI00308E73AB|nr:hypothetical protein OIE54_18140 [Streptomyces sp. NBC_01794]